MGYLVAKIIGLVVLAAASGFGLAYWWLRRRHRDVAEEYGRLVNASAAGAATTGEGIRKIEERLTSLEGVGERLHAALDEKVSALERTTLSQLSRPVDLEPVSQRLEALERTVARIGIPDLDPIEARLAGLGSIGDRLATIERQLSSLAPKAPDFSPVIRQLEALAKVVGDRMNSLEERMGSSNREPVDFGPVIDRLEAVDRAVAAVHVPDLGPLEARLGALGAIAERLHAMSQSVEKLAPAPADLGPVNRRIEALAGAMGDRLSSLEHAIVSLEPKPADLGPIEARLAAIMDRIRALGAGGVGPAPDLVWVQERMIRLEQQLDVLRGLLERVVARPTPAVVLPGSRNLLRRAIYGLPDDLKRIRGIGAGLEKVLHRLGVFYFWQVSEWDHNDIRFVDAHLDIFKGRIERDRWVEQAQGLAEEPGAARRPDSLGSPSDMAGA